MKASSLKLVLGFSTLALALGASNAHAKLDEHSVISERTVTLNVDISTAAVRLSSAGYSVPLVKVLVPELADVTLFDHRNVGEAAPCMATYAAQTPEQVIQNKPAVEKIPMTIRLTRTPIIEETLADDGKTYVKTCQIQLFEQIDAEIRGLHFTHERWGNVASRSLEDCR